jgi:hypothetical protein
MTPKIGGTAPDFEVRRQKVAGFHDWIWNKTTALFSYPPD